MTRFRKGDVVSIQTTVRWDQDGDGAVWVNIGSGAMVLVKDVTMLAPKFEIGERVVVKDGGFATARAQQGNSVWIELLTGGFATVEAIDLNRVPSAVEPEPSNVALLADHDPAYQRKVDAVDEIVGAPQFDGAA